MTSRGRNLPASVAARLRNRARAAGEDYQKVLIDYCFERFLYRLSRSPERDHFVLKGAMLLRVWFDQPYRATADLDLLRVGGGSSDAIRDAISAICSTEVEPDGVEFDHGSIRLEAIRAEDEYAGRRVMLVADCDTARLPLQIDVGVGDATWPAPKLQLYPAILEFPAPLVLTYRPESVVSEKLEAMIILGERNSRIKDFFDIHFLAERFEFDRATLVRSVRRTLARRDTILPKDLPIALTAAYWESPTRPSQIRAFARRSGLALGAEPSEIILPTLRAFLLPILESLQHGDGESEDATWPPGGPWQTSPGGRADGASDNDAGMPNEART